MSIKLQLPTLTDLRPRLTVIGVGGAGCNAINNMIAAGLNGVDFIVANTDAQALAASSAEQRIQLGVALTEGLGAGSKPEIGEAAAEEAIDDLRSQIAGSHMVFIAAGMGGGTGTGAAAVIARIARELGILTVGIVTKPFQFEGTRRMRIADIGVAELKKYVDTLIVIPNQNLFRVANERTTFAEAFVLADQVLYSGVACIVDLIIKEGLINLDFADVRTVMGGMGTAMMGTGEASGERRAIMAAEEAIANPLLDDVSLRGARGLLLSISGGRDLTLYEVDEAATRVRAEVDPEANIIVGATFDESLGDRVRVSIVASGMMRQGEGREQVRGMFEPLPVPPTPPMPMPQASVRPEPQRAAERQVPVQAHGRPPASPHQEPADVQRRLSAALTTAGTGSDDDPMSNMRWSDPHGEPPIPILAPQHGTHHAVPPHLDQTPDAPRGLWQAPGNVMIEEALPAATAPGGVRRAEPARPKTAPSPESFTPEPPMEIRRGPRRMPEVDDFPTVAQREYRAKTQAASAHAAEAPPARRPGLFERLAGMGKRADDSHVSVTPQATSTPAQRPGRGNEPRQRTTGGSERAATPPARRDAQDAEFPDVLSKDRR